MGGKVPERYRVVAVSADELRFTSADGTVAFKRLGGATGSK
jgi:hypothetical protein